MPLASGRVHGRRTYIGAISGIRDANRIIGTALQVQVLVFPHFALLLGEDEVATATDIGPDGIRRG